MYKTLTSQDTSRIRHLANAITVSRAILGLPLILALSAKQFSLAWIILLLGGLSDITDGWLARKAGGGSTWGARLDPLSDKILLSAPILWLASKSIFPIWSLWIIFARELLISGWRSGAHEGGPASKAGKLKTIFQFISILFLLWPPEWPHYVSIFELGWWLFWPSVLFAIISGHSYLSNR